jgi:hypothetical protein
MNITHFFEHWRITENPFRGEEARHDSVFARIALGDDANPAASHSDLEKILGELARPSTSIVFGEKGSGKTAIRMQIARRVRRQNELHPEARLFLVSYDDLNVFLGQLHARIGGDDPAASLRAVRLVDHLDAMLALAVTEVVDHLLGSARPEQQNTLGPDARRRVRGLKPELKASLRSLAAVYDLRDTEGQRSAALRRAMRERPDLAAIGWGALLVLGWIPPVGLLVWSFLDTPAEVGPTALRLAAAVLGLAYAGVALKRLVWDRFRLRRLARRISRQCRMLPRSEQALAASIGTLPGPARGELHTEDTDTTRYTRLGRLYAVLASFGYTGVLVIVDRVDEPTLVNGQTDRMQSIIWPLLNNKFLQQERLGVKMLLPLELRYALFKESSSFFQEARLDKQSLVERLNWTGAMLYDLCNARLAACRTPDAEPISLLDLFSEEVTRQDLVDALDQMHQPRDALKFLYRCLNEHCSNVTADEGSWRVPKLVLDGVRRQEVERVQQLYRGIRPA